MADPLIEFENVQKAYRVKGNTRVILEGFSGEFPRGRNIGLLGRNGSGKSTLIRMISGAEFPDRGTIHRYGSISYPLGFVGFKGTLTGRENCRFVARIYGLNVRSVEKYAEDFTELGKYFDLPISIYSSGMKARLSFAVSMAANFECYLMDETLATGDGKFKAKAAAVFQAKRAVSSLIMVSHSPSLIRRHCDMGAVLDQGKLRLFNTVEDAIRVYQQTAGWFLE